MGLGLISTVMVPVDSPTFTTTPFDISSRPLTTATITWSPENWDSINIRDDRTRTPNLATIVQEIINDTGWVGVSRYVIYI